MGEEAESTELLLRQGVHNLVHRFARRGEGSEEFQGNRGDQLPNGIFDLSAPEVRSAQIFD